MFAKTSGHTLGLLLVSQQEPRAGWRLPLASLGASWHHCLLGDNDINKQNEHSMLGGNEAYGKFKAWMPCVSGEM